jgi:hypothetical protein
MITPYMITTWKKSSIVRIINPKMWFHVFCRPVVYDKSGRLVTKAFLILQLTKCFLSAGFVEGDFEEVPIGWHHTKEDGSKVVYIPDPRVFNLSKVNKMKISAKKDEPITHKPDNFMELEEGSFEVVTSACMFNY